MAKPVLLTIDDDPEVLKAVERDLRRQYAANYRVLAANSGQAALALLEKLQQRGEPLGDTRFQIRLPLPSGATPTGATL
jgi:thioredoxin reductase (NADPH)